MVIGEVRQQSGFIACFHALALTLGIRFCIPKPRRNLGVCHQPGDSWKPWLPQKGAEVLDRYSHSLLHA